MFQSRLDVACSLTLDEMPGDLDLVVYLNIEMTIVLYQWFLDRIHICALILFEIGFIVINFESCKGV